MKILTKKNEKAVIEFINKRAELFSTWNWDVDFGKDHITVNGIETLDTLPEDVQEDVTSYYEQVQGSILFCNRYLARAIAQIIEGDLTAAHTEATAAAAEELLHRDGSAYTPSMRLLEGILMRVEDNEGKKQINSFVELFIKENI
jgi:hypothetical protein